MAVVKPGWLAGAAATVGIALSSDGVLTADIFRAPEAGHHPGQVKPAGCIQLIRGVRLRLGGGKHMVDFHRLQAWAADLAAFVAYSGGQCDG
jgi:hypothetical protein